MVIKFKLIVFICSSEPFKTYWTTWYIFKYGWNWRGTFYSQLDSCAYDCDSWSFELVVYLVESVSPKSVKVLTTWRRTLPLAYPGEVLFPSMHACVHVLSKFDLNTR